MTRFDRLPFASLHFLLLVILASPLFGGVHRLVLDLRTGQPTRRQMDYPIARAELTAGGDRIVGVEIEDDRLVITPLQEGRTTLFVFDVEETERDRLKLFVVKGTAAAPLDTAVRTMLSDNAGRPLPGLTVLAMEGRDKALIRGSVENRLTLERIGQVLAAFGDAVVDLTDLAPAFREQLIQEVRRALGNGNIEVTLVGRELILQGFVYHDAEKACLEAVARSLYPRVQSFLRLRPWNGPQAIRDVVLEKPLLLIECRILEVTAEALREMGIAWNGVQTVGLQGSWAATPKGTVSSVSLNTAKLFQMLIPQVEKGQARVLYSQNLVCEDGEYGKFFAGGSFHIIAQPPNGGDSVAIREVEYGIGLEIEPRTDREGNIQTTVRMEFSSLGPIIHLYPSLLKRYVQTTVNVQQGETLTLGALIGHGESDDVTKIPALGDIPVLGELFKSKNYRDRKSELVFLITPRRVQPGDRMDQALREDLARRLEKGGEAVQGKGAR
jgi:hypothetical protein